MALSAYVIPKLLDHVLKGTPFTQPTNIYVSLHTADPGTTGANECTGGSYARQLASSSFAAAGASSKASNVDINFTLMPAATVTFAAGAPGEALAVIANGFFEASAGGATVTGSAALTGTSALAASGLVRVLGASEIAGAGVLTGSGRVNVLGAVSLSGTSTLSATGQRTAVGAATLPGAGALTGSARLSVHGAATLTGVGTLYAVIVGDAVAMPTAARRTWRPGCCAAARQAQVRAQSRAVGAYPGLAVARKARGGDDDARRAWSPTTGGHDAPR